MLKSAITLKRRCFGHHQERPALHKTLKLTYRSRRYPLLMRRAPPVGQRQPIAWSDHPKARRSYIPPPRGGGTRCATQRTRRMVTYPETLHGPLKRRKSDKRRIRKMFIGMPRVCPVCPESARFQGTPGSATLSQVPEKSTLRNSARLGAGYWKRFWISLLGFESLPPSQILAIT
jgi:hypothetical protein